MKIKEIQLKCNETQIQSAFLKSEGYGPEICCRNSKLTLKLWDKLDFFTNIPYFSQTLVNTKENEEKVS